MTSVCSAFQIAIKLALHKTAAMFQRIINNPQVGASKAQLKCRYVLETTQMLMCCLKRMEVQVQHC